MTRCWREERKLKFNKGNLLIYAVTGKASSEDQLCGKLLEALKGGAAMVQFRPKGLGPEHTGDIWEEALRIRALTQYFHVPFIVDDNIELALYCGADGLHVGQDDMDPGQARKLLGPERILGVTAKTVEQAQKAQAQGADYLGCGAVFGTETKLDARPMPLETLAAICGSVSIPAVAIGGICLKNIGCLAGTGVAGAAIVSGIFEAADIRETTKLLVKAMRRNMR